MEGEFKIGIPGVGTTDFATTPIPPVTLSTWDGEDSLPNRTPVGFTGLIGRSQRGTSQIGGVRHSIFYSWGCIPLIDRETALDLGALFNWQQLEQKAKRLGALRLIDEIEYLDPEPKPHSKTLLNSIDYRFNSEIEYGFGVFNVQLVLPANWRTHLGTFGDGRHAKRVILQIEEL